ncbi:hypothetical protein KRP22_002816 [Phytophthora ramorum]|uniref:uncharacterized protein n=1 Tax=Phytophthora ramorum TaxID=164328 RepID=UPI00309D3D99|nr:hypothetical protein KRP23_634 [Phytophthora ramorum]KAH7503412.1 hypothetical protein KRP22_6464 [Phytophthora ramorum]
MLAGPLRVTYRTTLDGELRASMMVQLVKYLLFMRGQIPCLYDELQQFVATFQLQQRLGREQQPRKRRLPMSGGIKKAVKCVEAAELLFGAQFDAVFAQKVHRVALVFGSSLMSPREVVIVDFDDIEVDNAEPLSTSVAASPQTDEEEASLEDSQMLTPPSPPMTKEKLTRLCAQKLLRTLFAHSMELFSSALPATKFHVAVLAQRQSTRIPGFLPKQQFKLRLPKDKRESRSHYVVIYDDVDNRKQSQQEGVLEPADEQAKNDNASTMASGPVLASRSGSHDMMWYVLERPIPGFSEAIGTVDGK